VIARIRAARHEIAARFGHDTAKLVERYTELQQPYQVQMVDTAPATERVDQSPPAHLH
jgi:hypothetical protein